MWFDSPEKLQKLQQAAESWVGTPFCPNSRCKGKRGGVSCQMLAEQIYQECGVTSVKDFGAVSGSMSWASRHSNSQIEEFMNKRTDFISVEPSEAIRPGDLLGFKIGKVVHHVAVCINDKELIHCMRGQPTMICPLTDPTFKSRLARIWRPV